MMRNLLVIKLRYIGDVLLATPVLSALRKEYPDATLTVAVNRGTEDILRHNPDVNDIVVIERTSWWEQLRLFDTLRRRRFDCVIDLTDGDRSALMTWATRAPVRIGFNDEQRWRGALYSAVVPKSTGLIHRTVRDMAALGPIGIQSVPGPLTLRIDQAAASRADALLAGVMPSTSLQDLRLVMFQPGARYWFKAWPAERFAQLGDCLAQKWTCRILIGGTASEGRVAEELRSRMKAPATVLAGKLSLLEYAAVVSRCALFVGSDSGAMHIAAAVGTPLVALFGPSNPGEWGPRGATAEVLYKGLDCRACFHPTCDRGEQSCMKLISVEEVLSSIRRLMAGSDPVSGGRSLK